MPEDGTANRPERRRRSKARSRDASSSALTRQVDALRPGDRGGVLALSRGRVVEALAGRWDLLVWALLLSVALALRLWGLGDRALHHTQQTGSTADYNGQKDKERLAGTHSSAQP